MRSPAHLNDDCLQSINRGLAVVAKAIAALQNVQMAFDQRFATACKEIFACKRQLVVTGMGKSGLIARKIAATFSSTGTPAIFVHPGEAGHGDLGMIAKGDVLLVLSNSGNTAELRSVINYARNLAIPIIGVASRKSSFVAERSDIALILPEVKEACPINVAPTTSTTMQLVLGDALAMAVMEMRKVSKTDLHTLHPSGSIGSDLTPVAEIMHSADRLPLVDHDAKMLEAISVMTSGCFGLTGVTDSAGRLIGIITDGDVRRNFHFLSSAHAHEVMTRNPKIIGPGMSASDALSFLTSNSITAAFVVEVNDTLPQVPIGIVHIHDLLRLGIK